MNKGDCGWGPDPAPAPGEQENPEEQTLTEEEPCLSHAPVLSLVTHGQMEKVTSTLICSCRMPPSGWILLAQELRYIYSQLLSYRATRQPLALHLSPWPCFMHESHLPPCESSQYAFASAGL